MSINALANAAIARRADFAPAGRVPTKYGELATAAASAPAVANAGAAPASDKIGTALQILSGYIPTEVLTLYVAAIAAVHPLQKSTKHVVATMEVASIDWTLFWIFLVMTPLIVWIAFASKLKKANKPLPLKFPTWPVWEMSAGAVAFWAWELALPDTPFRGADWYTTGTAGFIVLAISMLLGLIAPLFQRPLAG